MHNYTPLTLKLVETEKYFGKSFGSEIDPYLLYKVLKVLKL